MKEISYIMYIRKRKNLQMRLCGKGKEILHSVTELVCHFAGTYAAVRFKSG